MSSEKPFLFYKLIINNLTKNNMKNNQKGFVNIILIGVIVVLLSLVGYFSIEKKSQQFNKQQTSIIPNTETQIRIAIETVLTEGKLSNPNEQIPTGIKLLSLKLAENNVTLNFSKEYLSGGQGVAEDVFSLVSNTITKIYPEVNKFTILIEGENIQDY